MAPERRRSLLVGVLVGLAVTLVAVAVLRSVGGDDSAADVRLEEPGAVADTSADGIATQGDVVGATLPTDAYARLDGGELRFADLAGTPVVVNLWASWCGPCVAEMPAFQRVSDAVGDRVAFVGVNHSDAESAARAMAERAGVTYPLVRDPRGTFAAELELARMPTTVFADADGRVIAVYPGEMSAEELQAEIDELLLS